jgi:biopolymer transport protein ExbB
MTLPRSAALLFLLLVQPVLAQEEATISMQQIMKDGGWTMSVLIVLSGLVVLMVVYFLLTLRASVLMPRKFRLEAQQLAEDGDVEALYSVCESNNSSGARIIGAAARILHNQPDADYQVIRDTIEDEGGRQSGALWGRIQYLMDIATIAPMVGLLGTVLGMIQAFVGLKDALGTVKPVTLANGVSKALVTTAGGLIVGIAAMILYSYFRGRVTRLVTQMEEQCSMVLQNFVVSASLQGGSSGSKRLSSLPVKEQPQEKPTVNAFPDKADE